MVRHVLCDEAKADSRNDVRQAEKGKEKEEERERERKGRGEERGLDDL